MRNVEAAELLQEQSARAGAGRGQGVPDLPWLKQHMTLFGAPVHVYVSYDAVCTWNFDSRDVRQSAKNRAVRLSPPS
jgi:hypothetical protein